jgi:SAM-dependent methyltransferase
MNLDRYRPTERFSSKARFYECRPDYPMEIVSILRRDLGLEPRHVVADVGAGTGKLARIFVENGNRVFALEPNAAMRAALEKNFPSKSNPRVLSAPAEATGLENESVDFIAVGQAYHWFDLGKTRIEFVRILRAPGFLLLASNDTGFADERLAARMKSITEKYFYKIEARIDFKTIDHHTFFSTFPATDASIAWSLRQEPERVFSGIRSTSFCPEEDDPAFEAMRGEFLDALYGAAVDGLVESRIKTVLTYGRMK